MQKKYRRMLIMLVYILVVSSTIAYSALTSTLQLNAEARLRTVSDIRVTDIKFSSASGGTLQYESTYDVNTITSGFVLPTTDSSITYKVTVTNNGTIDQTIYDILTQSSNNSGLYYEISGYNVRDVIGFKTVVEFYITYKTTTPSEEPINVVNKFNFKKVYHVTFEAKGGTSITDGIKYEGVDLDLSTFTSTKQGYILSGWTDEQDGTTVKYQTNGTYTLDRDLILYAVWEGNPNTSYSVNHYVHDLGTNTYTLDSTDNLTGTTDSTLTLASLKKTIPGFTYVDGYLTGGTTKPTSGAVTTTTILADGSRVINLYYRRNYLYVQYHVNGGQLAEQHGSHFGITNSLVTSTGNTTPNKFWVGVYGSKVNAVTNANTYTQGTAGLDNYNNPNYLNLEKTGYTGKSGQEWNTNASGTGTSYSQAATTYDANTFGGADLSTGDQVVTLYVNWVPVDYEIMYDLQGGTLATSNPATYNIETDTFTLNNPTLTGYTFTGWTGSNGNTPQTTVTIPSGSTGDKAYIANWQANTYDVTFDTNGGTIGANELFSFDGSNHTIDGTIVGATWGTDYLQFAGNTSSYVDLGQINSDYMTLQTTFSVDETISSTQIIIGNLESGGGSIHITQYQGQYVIEGQFYIDNSYRVIHSDIVPEVGKKYNVLLSYDGKIEKLYINDILIGSIEVEGVIKPPVSNTIMALGGNPYGSTMHDGSFKGKIYNASVYSNPKKQVTYDSPYGTLPTPTRDGYVFKGWNGKNKFNILNIESTNSNNWDVTIDNNSVFINHKNEYTNGIPEIEFDSLLEGQYYLNGDNLDYIALYINDEYIRMVKTNQIIQINNNDKIKFTFHTPTNLVTEYSNIQLEEGSTATTYEPYYVTSSTNVTQDKNHTLKAIWEKKEATFLPGTEFNAKIKQLAGNSSPTGASTDANITSIVRSNSLTIMPVDENVVSTSDSNTPIYAWFDNNNGTLYYYTEALTIYFNATTQNMFRGLSNLTSLDLTQFDASKIQYMHAMFMDCRSITNIDLSTLDFKQLGTDSPGSAVSHLFHNCYKLESITFGDSFDTSRITSLYYMFYNCNSLVTLDLSNFDLSKITYADSMLTGMTSLKSLKTPSIYQTDSSVKITLPKLMIDASGNEYTELDNTSPTNTMLYTPATFLPGQEFNAKIKQLAGNQDATYETADTNITSIVRTNTLSITPTSSNIVSTSDSYYPIYAWFDSNNGTIYYYTEALNPYMNSNSGNMFRNLKNLTSLDLSEFDTKYTTYMHAMFYNCLKLSSLNISNFDTSNVINMGYMFGNCKKLVTLDLSNFDMSRVTSVEGMFNNFGNPSELQTLKTPKVYPTDSSVKITLPKLMIDASENEYTELNSSSPTNTMLYTPATFLPGTEFNAKIKQLAGNENATYNTTDTNITSIVRNDTLGITPTDDNIVSTSDSNTPIYAWYDNGTIYYYTEEENPYMNTNASFMFYYLLNVTSIDISDVKTSNTNNMYSMFYNCRSLENIDVSNFNTSKVTNMSQMFAVNRALTTLDLSSFNTSNVTEMAAMFRYCNSLKELDLSKFDMTKVTNANLMITDLPVLESLKTPKVYPSEAVIQMPKTLYDPNGNAWAVLDSSAPTETWLHKMICKRATTLHTETCSQTSDSLYCSGAGYKVGGSKNTSTITYGSLGTNATTLNSGDAFTCDVNGDGTFNELTERFYYVGDYYNTTTKEFETDTGVLIYYNNVSGGTPNNTATSEYDTSGENWHGPVTAITQLPTTSQWTNISLKNNTRAILTYNTTNLTAGGTLPSDFSYSGYSARLLTVQEINNATGKNNVYQRLDDVAPYLFENTIYSTPSYDNRWWVENSNTNSISALSIYTSISENSGYTNGLYGDTVLGMHGVRPAIEVNKNFLNKKVNAYLITYDTNGGSENTTQTVTVGDSLGSLSVPTKEGYTFNGWYTAASGGEEVTTATVPTATTTYYAHWTPIDYNITYDLDGGTVTTNNPSTYNADSNAITLDNPTRNGYTFAGWSGGKEIKQGLPSDTAAANTTSRTFTTPLLVKGLAFNNYYYPSNVSSYSINNNSINIVGRSGYGVGFALLCEPNTDYTISYTSTVGEGASPEVGITYYARDGSLIKYRVNQSGGNQSLTTTSTSDSYYVVISFGVNATNFASITYSNISLSGTTDTIPYEGYVDKQTTITIPSGSVGNRKYTANWTANSYTVTADANGGSMPSTNGWTGTGNTATKSVTYDSQYGTLPTPTRNGYTFKGWNGKNLFNEMKKGVRIYPDNGEETADQDYASTNYISVDFSNGNSYYLSGLTNKLRSFIAVYDANKEFLGRTSGITRTEILLDSTSIQAFKTFDVTQAKYIRIQQYFNGTNSIDEIDNLSIQLEEGTTATPYEPYYVTSSTNVTQAKDHTLKAIWDMDTYEITYDLQGGTLASSNPATYNVETQTFTLNNPTLTGQAFIGWTGSNGNTPEVNVTIPVGSYGDKAYVAHFSPIYEPETRIRSLNTIGTSIADDDPDSNLRFIGSNPNNYVSFNGQKWRIIGVFDGKLKIIGDSIGKYSWDTSRNTVNNGYGINQWGVSGTYTGADLMKLLNPGYESNKDLKCNTTVTITDGVANCGDNTDSNYTTGLVNNSLYWNASSGYCYNYGNYKTTSCDFSTSGLKSDAARNMIDNATWYLGSNSLGNIWDGRMTASYLYNIERSNNTGKQCSSGDECTDDVTRTTTWQGKVGLVYPSDYAYATSGGTTYNRISCLSYAVGYVSESNIPSWQNSTYTDCKNNDWLLNTTMWTWTLTPRADTSYSRNTFNIVQDGYIRDTDAMRAESIRPVVYLKSSIKFTTGDGSFNSPFNLIDTE